MTMLTIIFVAILCLCYVAVGYFHARNVRGVRNFLPLSATQPHVKTTADFSGSTVATSVSLATVVIAIFELFPDLRFWLFWTAITTFAGLLLVRAVAPRIWSKITTGEARPTLHKFLGAEFQSAKLRTIAALFTTLGFLGALGVELTVGGRFIGNLMPGLSSDLWLVALCATVLLSIGLGGYRAAIVFEKRQIFTIYSFLIATSVFLISRAIASYPSPRIATFTTTGFLPMSTTIIPFLLGIFFINVPAYLSDMSVWQRIGGSEKRPTVDRGLIRSAFGTSATWTWIILLAFGAFLLIPSTRQKEPLFALISQIESAGGVFATLATVIIVLGLLGALLSTASTQLLAAVHALHEDILTELSQTYANYLPSTQLRILRVLLLVQTLLVVAIVALLTALGFSVADFVFAIYGAQLSLFPPVVFALVFRRDQLTRLTPWAICAISLGFASGWTLAILGKLHENSTVIFLAPVISLFVSAFILGTGTLLRGISQSELEAYQKNL